MRWRTTKGLVDEACWNGFVQHVRRQLENEGMSCTREAWPDLEILREARALKYERMDY